jgi:hypothetical protein
MLTPGTGEHFHLVFRDYQAEGGQVMNLPTFFDLSRHCSQVALARFALAGPMDHHLIGRLHALKSVSHVACLSASGFATRRTFLSLAFEAIT